MTGIEDGRPPVLQPCPSCGLSDEVVGVPAAYYAGRDSIRVTTPARFDDPEETVTRTVTTSLSRALAPAPAVLPLSAVPAVGFGVLLVLVSLGTFLGGALAGHWFSGDPKTPDTTTTRGLYVTGLPVEPAQQHSGLAFLGWISGFALLGAILLFVRARRRNAAQRRLLAGRADAERRWAQGWYCRRCGSVHFRAEPGGRPRALTLQEFRAEVWAVGGYGHLAERGMF